MKVFERPAAMALLVVLAAMSSSCGSLGSRPQLALRYDLGLIEPAGVPSGLTPASIELRSPSWLSTGAMQYRLAFHDAARRQVYAESRWVAEPAELLGMVLDRALRGGGEPDGDCRLRVHLDEFQQVFDSPQRSRAQIVARAELLPGRSEVPLARKAFDIEIEAPSADAAGGVAAHKAAARRFVDELAAWLGTIDRDAPPGLNSTARCMR